MLIRRFYILSTCIAGILLLCITDLIAQKDTKKPSISQLNNWINSLSSSPSLKHASWGVCVMDVKTRGVIAKYNSDQSLIPASTMKVVTTMPALSILGQNYKFKTSLAYNGEIDSNGVLFGDLYIKGGGDPTFGSNRFDSTSIDIIFEKWLKKVQAKKIKRINGAVIGDATIFDNLLIPQNWEWVDIGNYYGAGVSGLSLNENYYKVVFKPATKTGGKAKILRTEPELPWITFVNNVTTAKTGTGDNVIIYGSPFSNIRFLEGTVPYGKREFKVKGSIPDPSYTVAALFNDYLSTNGISVRQQPTTIRELKIIGGLNKTELTEFDVYHSPPLIEIVNLTNEKSINSFAETLVKILGSVKAGEGSYGKGIRAIRNYWVSKGVDLAGFMMKDGSGLSRANYISTKHQTAMLCACVNDSAFGAFYNSLPIASKSGSLKNLFKGTGAEKNLRAKSGYMIRVRAYTGYVTNKSKKLLAFSIIVNNYEGSSYAMKKKLEKLMVLIAETE